ncbi:acetyl-CoA carboxylase biotin carboxylase subunit family protein [Actinophytocola sp.]|uniref:ATP-grasp domain-containing protein n=1 Tax=Actinophytocola sp. TaxID=1872138 RepID=UPI00389AB030
MGILILHHRGGLSACQYDSWLPDYDGDLVLLASREHLGWVGEELPSGPTGYRHLEAVDGYELTGVVESRVLELAERFDVTDVLSVQEHDLERTAQLREILGLPGHSLADAEVWRNKALMKQVAARAGIPVAAHRTVECATDLIAFAHEHGYPIVAKPRDGAGALGVRVLRSRAELDAFLAEDLELYGPYQSNLMVEAFVDGPMCHVDGLVVDGELRYVYASRYLFTLSDFRSLRQGRLDTTFDPDDPLGLRLVEFTKSVLDALPAPRHFAFHAEVFHTPDHRLVLCEIAARPGGAQNRWVAEAMFGIDPVAGVLRAHAGLPLGDIPARPVTMSGQLLFGKRPGRVVSVPGEPPFPWVTRSVILAEPGQVFEGSRYSADVLASFVVVAPDSRTTEARMRQLEEWFLDGLVIEPLEVTA